MLKNYLKVAFRTLRKQKLYSLINILGLAVGLAFCVLVLLFINDELTYDQFHADSDRIYRLYRLPVEQDSPIDMEISMPLPTGQAMKEDFPAVEDYVRFVTFRTVKTRHENNFHDQEGTVFSDPSIFSVFTFPLRFGDPATALDQPNSVVLTPETARKYFGSRNPLGETLSVRLNGRYIDFTVSGVTEPIPSNSTIDFEILMPMQAVINNFEAYSRVADRWDATRVITYVRLRDNQDLPSIRSALPDFMENHMGDIFASLRERGALKSAGSPIIYQLQPLTDIHLNPEIPGGFKMPSSPAKSYILGGIALAVLLIACINFMLLAIGRSASRAKEVGMRKVSGASRKQLVYQFWGEAMLLTFFAFGLGIGLAEAFMPVFNELSGKALSLASMMSYPYTLALLAAIFMLTGLIAGSYPALVLSGYQPVDTLKQKIAGGGANFFTRSLVVTQFALSVFLVSGTLIMSNQLDYMREKNLGFNGEQVVVVPLQGLDGERVLEIFRNELNNEAAIQQVSAMSFAFDQGLNRRGFQHEGEGKETAVFRVTPNFIKAMDMTLLAGRNFNPDRASDSTSSIIVNEAFLEEFGWAEEPLGKSINVNWGPLKNPAVIGVVQNFHFQSLRDQIEPAMLYTSPVDDIFNLVVRIAPQNMPESIEKMRAVWNGFTNEVPFSYRFLDDGMDRMYRSEERWSKIVGYGSLFAIIIACMGLFGLAGITALRRRKEIGIRKVLGATISGIIALLSKEFARLVVVGIVIATPLAYYFMQQWLQNFAYRVELGAGIFLMAGLVALAVALATVGWHAFKAARMNPANSLRNE